MPFVPSLEERCLYSRVKNTSGRSMFFSFLPPHGRRLAAAEEHWVHGDINTMVAGMSRRHQVAFKKAIDMGVLQLMSTPNPRLVDVNSSNVTMLVVASGNVDVVRPCEVTSSN